MRAETIQLFALISLRALADYDAPEFRRSTDLSKGELDRRIDTFLLSHVNDDELLVGVAREQLGALRSAEREAQSPAELSFLLRSLSGSLLERAHQLALSYSREEGREESTSPHTYNRSVIAIEDEGVGREEEFLRLGVMRLLRDLPGYTPRFDYRLKNIKVDCFLEPITGGQPPILIEAKMLIGSIGEAQITMRNLKNGTAGLSSNVLGVILTAGGAEALSQLRQPKITRLYVLIYDPESNEFATKRSDLERLLIDANPRRIGTTRNGN